MRLFLVLLFITQLLCCTTKEGYNGITQEPSIHDSIEWMSYIDSSRVLNVESVLADSFILYYLSPEAPAIIGNKYLVIWRNGKEINIDDFSSTVDDYTEIDKNHFVFSSLRKRTAVTQEVKFGEEIFLAKEKILDVTKTDCIEVRKSYFVDSLDEQIFSLKIRLENLCFNTQNDSLIHYTPKL